MGCGLHGSGGVEVGCGKREKERSMETVDEQESLIQYKLAIPMCKNHKVSFVAKRIGYCQ